MTVSVRSFAKINLGLYIGALRADGFHELRTVYQTIALHDVIRVSVARGSGIEILCKCEDPRVPLDSTNTCYRMASLVMQELGATGKVTIEIEKKLPVQGGLGAASSNAVATMFALEKALGFPGHGKANKRRGEPGLYRETERLRIAAEVGSDLPLFVLGGTVLGVGRGEEVYPLADLPVTAMVVVTPEVGVSTPRAFADWDEFVTMGQENLKPRRTRGLTEGTQGPLRQAQDTLRAPGGTQGPRRQAQGRLSTPQMRSRASASAPVGMTERGDLTGEDAPRFTTTPELTRSAASDRLFEVGCALSTWLTG